MNKGTYKPLLGGVFTAAWLACSLPAYPDDSSRLSCLVDGSDDRFELYPRQLSYRGNQFDHYQLIGGLTVVIVHRDTRRFNRLSKLNLLPYSSLDPSRPAEPIQFFSGQCLRANTASD